MLSGDFEYGLAGLICWTFACLSRQIHGIVAFWILGDFLFEIYGYSAVGAIHRSPVKDQSHVDRT